jgi:histidine triad (HIT) family protein
MIPKEQSEEIKKQLLEQVGNLPNENKEQIKEYIKGLDEKGLEEFLKKNKIKIANSESGEISVEDLEKPSEQECIFCLIIKNKVPSYKITETKKEIAILEINPLSKGHSIILPLEHTTMEKLPKSALLLAQKIAKKIKKKLKPEDIKIETSSLMGHAMINIIPLYKDTLLKKIKENEKDLKQLQSKLETKKRSSRKKQSKSSNEKTAIENISKLPKVHFRIP